MAMSPDSPTSFLWSPVSSMSWLLHAINGIRHPPKVVSISYGIEAIKLWMKGVTILCASGDDGAVSAAARQGDFALCFYDPLFPASSPYVVAVGATSGVENNEKEVVCSANTTSSITSGGGFSNNSKQPFDQTTHVNDYFIKANKDRHSPVPGYNINGRGYPDISMAGLNYLITIYGKYGGIAGTSASAPVAGGFISNINAARMALGKGPVGWINPALHKYANLFVNDITKGDITCANTVPFCAQGFHATIGWDPASGLGSLDYTKMQDVFIEFGDVTSITRSSSMASTEIPSSTPSFANPVNEPTIEPTRRKFHPNRLPTRRPKRTTSTPTSTPTSTSTITPTACTPTNIPTISPVHKPSKTPLRVPTVVTISRVEQLTAINRTINRKHLDLNK